MRNRQLLILYYLMKNKYAITSNWLAQLLGCSIRTVKSEMTEVGEILSENGAELVSKRNVGYSIKILNSDIYLPFYESIVLKGLNLNLAHSSESSWLLYIARKLVASPSGVKVEQLTQDLYLSRTTVREPLRKAREFCESFHLKITHSSSQGIRIFGPEHMIRIAMTELFEIHFHKAKMDESDREYAQWIGCEYQERQDIRHAFLKVLRESGYSLRDSMTQRIAMYLIIARNRIRAGHYITLPSQWISEIMTTPLYKVADNIFIDLERSFSDYQFSVVERVFLAIYMLSNLDIDLKRNIKKTASFLYQESCEASEHILQVLKKESGFDFAGIANGVSILQQAVMPILAGQRYGLDGYMHFDYDYELTYLKSPICAYFARSIGLLMQEFTGCLISKTDLAIFSCCICALLNSIDYDIKPLRLLTTNFIGTEFAKMQTEKLQKHFPNLIEQITAMELYEIRGVKEGLYDAVLVGNAIEGNELLAFNYDYPYTSLLMTKQGRDYNNIYNDILIDAYQTKHLLPKKEEIQVIKEFRYHSPELFYQFLSLRHARDEDMSIMLEADLIRQGQLYTIIEGECVFLFTGLKYCQKPCTELYVFRKRGHWGEKKFTMRFSQRLIGRRMDRR